MSKKNIIRISFFGVLILLGLVGYVSMGGMSASQLTVEENVEHLVYGHEYEGSAKTIMGTAFKKVDSLLTDGKYPGEPAGYFYVNPSQKNKGYTKVFVGLKVDKKLEKSIDGFEYRTFKFKKSIEGKQDAFFLFSTLYNDIFQYAEANAYVLDSIQSFERYPGENKTIIEIPFKGSVGVE